MKKKYNPKVSIIIPVYNGSKYMKEAINSALNQTYKNIEVIVINDGSNDNNETDKIAKSYGKKIRYYVKENGGVSTALNLGIRKMKGSFFSWLSHDDIYYPNKIEIQINYLIKNNLFDKKVITYTNYDVINERSAIIGSTKFQVYKPNSYPEYALLRGLISGIALLIPKKAFDEHGLFDEKYRCVQDYLLFYEFMKTYHYIFIPKVTNATRVHDKQVTKVNPKVISENNMLWIKMQKDLPEDKKIKLEGSLYKFYFAMYNFLINHNNYTETHDYSLNEANKYLKKEYKNVDKIIEKYGYKKIYVCIHKCYLKTNMKFKMLNEKFASKFCNVDIDDALKNQIKKIINNIGIENLAEYFVTKSEELKKARLYYYYKLFFDITKHDQKDLNKMQKVIYSMKTKGITQTIHLVFKRIGNKMMYNAITNNAKKILKYNKKN